MSFKKYMGNQVKLLLEVVLAKHIIHVQATTIFMHVSNIYANLTMTLNNENKNVKKFHFQIFWSATNAKAYPCTVPRTYTYVYKSNDKKRCIISLFATS